jgi:branched-chain amino acid transport system permease protein
LFSQLILSGIAQGAIYALVALSMTVVYRATTIVNFGHGDMVMSGAFIAYLLVVLLGLPFLPAALLAVALLFILGVAIQRGLIEPIKAGPHMGFAMMSIAVGYVLRGIARAGWGREVLPMPRVFDIPPLFVGDLILTGDSIVVIGVVATFLTAFFIVFHRTRIGQVIQAVYQSERGANFLIRGFAAMTLGGFGSLGGAIAGGLLLGVAEQLLGFYVSTKLIDIAAYLVIISVLILRPVGLFGKAAIVRV